MLLNHHHSDIVSPLTDWPAVQRLMPHEPLKAREIFIHPNWIIEDTRSWTGPLSTGKAVDSRSPPDPDSEYQKCSDHRSN